MSQFDFSKIKVENTSSSQPDGYGGELTWYYTVFSYKGKRIKNERRDCLSRSSGINEKQIEDLIGERLTLDLRCQLYVTNQDLFFMIGDMNKDIRDMVLGTVRKKEMADLEKMCKRLRGLFHEYDELFYKVYGRSPSRFSFN